MVNMYVCRGFGSNDFMTNDAFPMDGYYKTDVISGVGHPRSDSVVLLVLHSVQCAMARALALYYRFLGTTSTLVKRVISQVDHIVKLLLLLMIINIYYIIYISPV
jgi:hypothetical protein